jgi:hypothetical protein
MERGVGSVSLTFEMTALASSHAERSTPARAASRVRVAVPTGVTAVAARDADAQHALAAVVGDGQVEARGGGQADPVEREVVRDGPRQRVGGRVEVRVVARAPTHRRVERTLLQAIPPGGR